MRFAGSAVIVFTQAAPTAPPARDTKIRDDAIKSALEAPLQASAVKLSASVEPGSSGGDLALAVGSIPRP